MNTDIITRHIVDVPDFPKPGIVFKDITPLLAAPAALEATVSGLCAPYRDAGITKVVAMESRGFLFGVPVAMALGCGFVPVRKPGKLPRATLAESFSLEYGQDTLEIHADALGAHDVVLVVDDVLATGGTAAAVHTLIGRCGARCAGAAFVIELDFLHGRDRLADLPVHALVHY